MNVKSFALLASVFFLAACKKEKKYPPVGPTPANTSVLATKNYSKNGLTLIFTNNDPLFDTAIRQKMANNFFIVYPLEMARFNPNAITTVTFSMDTAYSGVAAAGGGKVTFSASYYRSNPKDIDVVTHEVMHLVQAYPNYNPSWLVEGIADYARYKYGVDNVTAGWTLPAYSSSQKYTDSYRVTARFLAWLENHLRTDIVDKLDAAMRSQTYSTNTWSILTGKTVDELWQSYGQSPAL